MAMKDGMDAEHQWCMNVAMFQVKVIDSIQWPWIDHTQLEGVNMHGTSMNTRAHACPRMTIDGHA